MKIVISSGHGKYIRGASGSPVPPELDEVDEARKVVERVADFLRRLDVETITFHDNTSHDQSTNLNTIVNFHNKQSRDYDISVHFNATEGAHGCEVLYKTQEKLAKTVVDKICSVSGLTNRGPKYRGDLKFLNSTEQPAILIETCFCDSTSDSNIYREHFEDICQAIAEGISGQTTIERPPERPERPPVQPPVPPSSTGHVTVKKGSTGADVIELQKALGVLDADGDFGSITDTWVRAFQGSCGLSTDGIVGDKTWAEVDDLEARVRMGEKPLPKELADRIYTMAQTSEIADYSWKDRGIAPPGYIAGMALSFAYASRQLQAGNSVAVMMSQRLGGSDTDALVWYQDQFGDLGMSNLTPTERLRHLFVLMIGLGPRESSGRYFEGRDLSASNVTSDTCEVGLCQTSWNIRNGTPTIEPLLDKFWRNPNGFLPEFKEGLSPSANNLNSYGSGDGLKYQFLSRFCPLFHVIVTGCGLRVLRKHWGPIVEHAAEVKREADELLQDVERITGGDSESV